MESVTVENYLKAIYQLSDTSGGVPTGELARRLKITPGSVTLMLQRLAEAGLVSMRRIKASASPRKARKRRFASYATIVCLSCTSPVPWGCPGTKCMRKRKIWNTRFLTGWWPESTNIWVIPTATLMETPFPTVTAKCGPGKEPLWQSATRRPHSYCCVYRIGRPIFYATSVIVV